MSILGTIVRKWPGKQRFGMFRFAPFFFGMGALIEFTMIHLNVGNTNFYDVYRRKHPDQVVHKPLDSASGVALSAENQNQNSFIAQYQKYLEKQQADKELTAAKAS